MNDSTRRLAFPAGRVAAAVLLSLLGWGCDEDDPLSPPEHSDQIVFLNPPTFLSEGQQIQLEVEVHDVSGAIDTAAVVSWSSSRPELASVDATGLLTVHAAAPALGSPEVTLLDPTIVRIRAQSGAEASEWDLELRGWRYARASPGLGFVSPLTTRDSEEWFTGAFTDKTLRAPGAPMRLRLVCPTIQPNPTMLVTLEAPAAMLVPDGISVVFDQDPLRTFGAWTPDTSAPDSAATRFTLDPVDAAAFTAALTQSSAAAVNVVLTSNPTVETTVNFRVNGFDRFWVGSNTLLGECQ